MPPIFASTFLSKIAKIINFRHSPAALHPSISTVPALALRMGLLGFRMDPTPPLIELELGSVDGVEMLFRKILNRVLVDTCVGMGLLRPACRRIGGQLVRNIAVESFIHWLFWCWNCSNYYFLTFIVRFEMEVYNLLVQSIKNTK